LEHVRVTSDTMYGWLQPDEKLAWNDFKRLYRMKTGKYPHLYLYQKKRNGKRIPVLDFNSVTRYMEQQGWSDARLADALLDMGARERGPPMPLTAEPPRKRRRLEPNEEQPLRDTTETYTAEIAGGAPFITGNITHLATKMSDRQRKHVGTGARPRGMAVGGEERKDRPKKQLRTYVPLVKRMKTLRDLGRSPMEEALYNLQLIVSGGVKVPADEIVTEDGITRFRPRPSGSVTKTINVIPYILPILKKYGVKATNEELTSLSSILALGAQALANAIDATKE
jgi:hypothetical protein